MTMTRLIGFQRFQPCIWFIVEGTTVAWYKILLIFTDLVTPVDKYG